MGQERGERESAGVHKGRNLELEHTAAGTVGTLLVVQHPSKTPTPLSLSKKKSPLVLELRSKSLFHPHPLVRVNHCLGK